MLECQKWMNTGRKKSERKIIVAINVGQRHMKEEKVSDTKEVLNIITDQSHCGYYS